MARYEARERRAAPPRTRHLDAELAATAGYGGVELGSSDGREGTVRRATLSASITRPVSRGQHRAVRREIAHAAVVECRDKRNGETCVRLAAFLYCPT